MSTLEAGWSDGPLLSNDSVHWWRPNGRRACDPDHIGCYTGHKTLQTPPMRTACSRCMTVVSEALTAAREILGADL